MTPNADFEKLVKDFNEGSTDYIKKYKNRILLARAGQALSSVINISLSGFWFDLLVHTHPHLSEEDAVLPTYAIVTSLTVATTSIIEIACVRPAIDEIETTKKVGSFLNWLNKI